MPLAGSIPPAPLRSSDEPNGATAPAGPTQLEIHGLARKAGFTEAGIVGLPYPETARDAARYTQFIDHGRAGSMSYLARRNQPQGELLRSRPDLPFPWARSGIVCLAGYHADAPLSTQPAPFGAAWIARYAWSGKKDSNGAARPSDYHKVLLQRLRRLETELHNLYGDFECRAYVDTGPVVERNLARAAGLGWTGKNTCLIHPRLGSWNFLAVLVTSLQLPVAETPLTVPDRCGSCRRCLDACPTQALVEPYQMDATRCISYLTIELRGDIPDELRGGMGRQVFGCDICQDVCPWNRKSPIGAEDDLAARGELINPQLEWLAELELADFERLFNGSPIRRAGFVGLRRNIAIAMGNSGLIRYLPWLERWADRASESVAQPLAGFDTSRNADADPIQNAARWALNRIRKGSGRAEPVLPLKEL